MQKLLVVEDSQFDKEIISRTLVSHASNYDAHFEQDAETARFRLFDQNENFDLIIADHHLPGMTGLEFCKMVRGHGLQIPFVIMTGGGSEQVAVDTLKAGADDYVIKDELGHFANRLAALTPKLIHKYTQRRSSILEEEQLYTEIRKLQLKNQELDAFSEMVAYDLKAPLSLIVGFAHILKSSDQTDQIDFPNLIERIIRLGNKSVDIIESLFIFSTANNQSVIRSMVNAQVALDEAALRLSDEIEKSGSVITINGELPACFAYKPWLEEIWYNLLSNAIKHSGAQSKINISAVVNNNSVCYWVCDNGIGISDVQQPPMFEPFVRFNGSNGAGLGLSIVKRIIERLGGEVGVQSQVGSGSSFYFILPSRPVIETRSERLSGNQVESINRSKFWQFD